MNAEIGDFGKEIFRAGNWILTDECIYWDKKEDYPYPIIKERYWELRPDNNLDKFDWPLHLVEKTWLTVENIYQFNIVFFYALDFFQTLKPINNKGCIWKTLAEQHNILEEKKRDFNF